MSIPPEEPIKEGKYARVERERRFLLAGSPSASAVTARRRITDRYLPGTRLRLRRVENLDSGAREYKLTQKWAAPRFPDGVIRVNSCCGLQAQILVVDLLRRPVPER